MACAGASRHRSKRTPVAWLVPLVPVWIACGQSRLTASVFSDGASVGGNAPTATGGAETGGTIAGGTMASGGAPGGSGSTPGVIGLGGLGSVPTPPDPYEPAPTLFVYEGRLRDHCGEPMALRGVAEFIARTPGGDGDPEFSEMAKTGANAARVMWEATSDALALERAIENSVTEGLVPVLELQDTFRMGPEEQALAETLDYWLAPEVNAVLRRHEETLIVEISSWVTQSAPRDEWVSLYADAIDQLRAAGIRVPIAIVEPTWFQDPAEVAAAMTEITETDPTGNVLLAFDLWTGGANALQERLTAFSNAGVASYISEFSEYRILDCPNGPTDVSAVMAVAAENDGSWFAWSWGAVQNGGACAGYLDMTTDGTWETLTEFGALVALEDPNGISRTATAFQTGGVMMCPR